MTNHTPDVAELSGSEHETLRAIAGHIIPSDGTLGVPGADDAVIFADIVRTVHRDEAALRAAIAAVTALAGDGFASLPGDQQAPILQRFRAENPRLAQACETVVARCYYRDPRVMRSIGMEIRPPFPLGFEVEQGDWDMLEPVRRRGKIYRDAE